MIPHRDHPVQDMIDAIRDRGKSNVQSKLRKLLEAEARKKLSNYDTVHPANEFMRGWEAVDKFYQEDTNPDAINGDDWLKKRTSYIWKVAVLAVTDGNKCDYADVFIGHQRDPKREPEIIGQLSWGEGENDDIGRCLRRYLKLLDICHPVFEDK